MNKLFESLKERFPNNVLGTQRRISPEDFSAYSLITVDGVVTDIRVPLEEGFGGIPLTEKDEQMVLDHFTEKIKKIIS